MKFEKILEEINGFGSFQLLLIVLLCSPRIVLPCHYLLNIFIATVPPHHCDLSDLSDLDDAAETLTNLSDAQRLTVSVPKHKDGTFKSCEMFAERQFQLLSNISNISADVSTVQCHSGWVYDNSSFSSTLATEWDLVCDRKSLRNTTGTIFFLGVMVGSIVFGFLCDKYGRKKTLLVSYVISMVFSLSTIEWVDADHRSFIGVIGSLSWSVGNMMLAGFAFLVNDWRTLVMVVTAPLGLAVLTWWWIPESARWLLANGKVETAQFYLDRCAKFNKRAKVNVETLCNKEDLETQDKNYTYLHLIKTPKIRKISVIIGIVWFGVAATYYGISLNIGGLGLNVYLTHFIYAAIEVPAKLMIYCLLDIIGRRKCQSGTLLLTGTCIAINILVPRDLWIIRSVVAILGKGLSEAAFTTVFLYTSELYPTVVRQNALGYANFVSRVGVSVAPLVLLLDDVWTPLPQIVLCCVAVSSGLASLLLPETLKARLPQTIDDIEEERGRNIVSSHAADSSAVFLEPKSEEDS
ncbi:solute carrier family 22 member 7-like isoform X2 [Solea solea]|uniref:solute carrier family 22 member 7-like isoform X2 n=1 Tax=Solea solea TaxID=90069 RepID=UPI00272D820C|nr:solute carrier family 22 member 7-like isoform X2 [Solea solea]